MLLRARGATIIASQVPPSGRAVLLRPARFLPSPALPIHSFFLSTTYAFNDILGASVWRGVLCAYTTWGWKRERDRYAIFDSNTNYRLPGRPLTRLRRSVTLLRPLSGTYAHAHVLEMAFTDTHVSLSLSFSFSLESRSFLADRARSDLGSHSLLSRCLCGETRQSPPGSMSRSRPRELFTGGHSSARQLFSRLEDWLLSLLPLLLNELVALLLLLFLFSSRPSSFSCDR